MIFAIDESGDLNYDPDEKILTNTVVGDEIVSDKKIIKTTLITYFIHKNMLKDHFIKNERNYYEDSEIKEKINVLLNRAFTSYGRLRGSIDFIFINKKSSIDFLFFYSGGTKEIILERTVKI